MYRLMEEYNLHSAEEALAAVKSGESHSQSGEVRA